MTVESDLPTTVRTSSNAMEQYQSDDEERHERLPNGNDEESLQKPSHLLDRSTNTKDIIVNGRIKDGPCTRPVFPGEEGFDENNAALPVVINEWAQGTSIHGVPLVTDATVWKFWKRAIWIVLVFISAGFMLWQVTQLIRQYRDYEVITDTETINPESLEFPRITVCNASPFSQSRKDRFNIPYPKNEEEFVQVSTPLEEFIGASWFNGIELNVSEVWKPVILPEEVGRCWAFDTNETVRRPGYYGGLKIWIDLRQYDYDKWSEFAAAFLWSQHKDMLLDSQLPIATAKPGHETLISLQMSQFQREKQLPWARCEGEAPEYTQGRCRSECIMEYIREKCQCRRYGDETDKDRLDFCPPDDECLQFAINSGGIVSEQQCPNACDMPTCAVTEYEFTTAEANFAETWLEQFPYDDFNITEEYLLQNFVSVTVNFRRIQYSLLTESKAVSFAQLLGSIGGSMGFFLGISLLSIFELVGDLGMLRLLPRWFGHRHLYGLGAVEHKVE